MPRFQVGAFDAQVGFLCRAINVPSLSSLAVCADTSSVKTKTAFTAITRCSVKKGWTHGVDKVTVVPKVHLGVAIREREPTNQSISYSEVTQGPRFLA